MSHALFMDAGGRHLHYRIDGDPAAPWLLMSHSLGTNLTMWEPQMSALLSHFQVLRYDTRGHGMSSLPPGPCKIADLGEDVLALLDFLRISQAHFCGLSLGGMTGMWLAAHHPQRFARLALCNTSPFMPTPDMWNARIDQVNREGMEAIAPGVINRWFTTQFQAQSPASIACVREMLLRTAPQGYNACCGAIRDMDQRAILSSIKHKTLVIAGSRDEATPPQDGRTMASQIAGSSYVELHAAHLSNWEQVSAFGACVTDFLAEEA